MYWCFLIWFYIKQSLRHRRLKKQHWTKDNVHRHSKENKNILNHVGASVWSSSCNTVHIRLLFWADTYIHALTVGLQFIAVLCFYVVVKSLKKIIFRPFAPFLTNDAKEQYNWRKLAGRGICDSLVFCKLPESYLLALIPF